MDLKNCTPCPPYWLRALLYFPSDGGGPVPPLPADCCFLLEDDSGTLAKESGSGCLQPEDC